MFYPQALAIPVVLGESGPSHFFLCNVLTSLLLLAVVVKLEPSSAWTSALFPLGFKLLVLGCSLRMLVS